MSSYSYDSFGNITETERPNSAGVTVKNTYSYENSSWRDLLTAYNGHTITYDKIGNPLSYYNGRSYTLRWEMGRQLLSSRVNSRTVYYDYNKDGIRIKKNVSGRYTDRYILDGSKVIGMERTKSGSSVKDVYHFIYDEMGNIWEAICYIGGSTTPVRYYYRTNAQGDVKQIVDSNYNVVAYYAYDAWGKLLAVLDGNDNPITDSSHFAVVNPFRYRGYVYDTETGFYYLQSRYYDPEIGRFINADGEISGIEIGAKGYNLFAYCYNDPVNMFDETGQWPSWGRVLKAAIGVAIIAVAVAAIVVAAPVLTAAATVGYVSGIVAASGTIVCASVATVCGGSLIGEAITGKNPVRDLVGQDNFDAITTISTAGAAQGLSDMSALRGTSSPGAKSRSKLEKYVENPEKIKNVPVPKIEKIALKEGLSTGTLTRGSHEGQGFKVYWGGDRLIQYHPGGGHHGIQSYWKISSGKGTIRIFNDK